MMLVLSLTTLIGEASLNGDAKRLSGNVADLDTLLQEDSLRALEAHHHGVFAFLAYHPGIDVAVSGYVTEGTLAADSGPGVLVLFTAAYADAPVLVSNASLAGLLTIERAELPAQQMTRLLFSERQVPVLPGLLVFDHFTGETEALYFPLDEAADPADVRTRLRGLFSLIEHSKRSVAGSRRPFADVLAVAAQREELAFVRSGRTSMRQWLVQAYQLTKRHAADIVGALGLVPL
jgi:hypothetical protein